MNTQDGSELWGYHNNAKSLWFQKPVDIKKVDAKNYFIFKYVVENTSEKKSYQIYIGKPTFFFRDRATRRDLSLYRKCMERVKVVYTLEAVNFGAWRDRGILFLRSKWTCAKANENKWASFVWNLEMVSFESILIG